MSLTLLEIEQKLKTGTVKQKVLYCLWIARSENKRYCIVQGLREHISGGWLPMWILQSPLIGGTSADRRLRELREHHGIPLECRKHEYINDHGESRHIWIHRIAFDPRCLDWEEVFAKKRQYFYTGPKGTTPTRTPPAVQSPRLTRPVGHAIFNEQSPNTNNFSASSVVNSSDRSQTASNTPQNKPVDARSLPGLNGISTLGYPPADLNNKNAATNAQPRPLKSNKSGQLQFT